MPRINIEGYEPIHLPDYMSRGEMEAEVSKMIDSGRIKPLDQKSAPQQHSQPYMDVSLGNSDNRQEISNQDQDNNMNRDIFGLSDWTSTKPSEALLESIIHGLKRGGAGIIQGLHPIAEIMAPSLKDPMDEKMSALKNYMQQEDNSFDQRYGESLPHNALSTISEISPMLLGGAEMQLGRAPKFIGEALKNSPAILRNLGALGGVFGKNAAVGGAYAPFSYNESFDKGGIGGLGEKAAEGAVLGGLLGSGMSGIGKLAADFPGIIGKGLSQFGDKESALRSIPALQGLPSNLGDAISSPFIKDLEEKWLAKNPFSGTRSSQYLTGKRLEGEGENILKDLAPNYATSEGTVNVGKQLQGNLKEYDKSIKDQKRDLYKKVDDLARKLKVKVEGKNYSAEAKNILSQMEEGASFGKLEDEQKAGFEAFLEKISQGGKLTSSKSLPQAGFLSDLRGSSSSATEPFKKGSVKGANLKISDLNETALLEEIKGNEFISGAYKRLAKALKSDLENAIYKSGSPTFKKGSSELTMLKHRYDKAQDFYKKFVAPLNEKEVYKFTHGNADSDTLVNFFLRTGKQDRSNLLSKLTKNISSEDRQLLGREFLEGARQKDFEGMTKISPKEMIRLYEGLGNKTKKELFDNKNFEKRMSNFSTRVRKNPSAVESLFVPKTGESGPYAATMGGLYLSALAGAGPLAASLGTLGGSAGLAKFLRSDKARELYLRGLNPTKRTGRKTGAAIGGAIGLTEREMD